MQYLKTQKESASPFSQQKSRYISCDLLAKFALLLFGIALWYKVSIYFGYGLIVLAWILDGGLHRSRQIIKEPLVLAILFFCAVYYWEFFGVTTPILDVLDGISM